MKVIFLHGIGQMANSWNHVRGELIDYPSEAPELFENGILPPTFSVTKTQMLERLRKEDEDFILVGLSLGGTLALALSEQWLPHLKGLVISAGQYDLKHHRLYSLQIAITKLIPAGVFKKHGMDKKNLVHFLQSMKTLDLTDGLSSIHLPVRVVCGSKDRVNLATSQQLANLLPQVTFSVVPDGGHQLNIDQPERFAAIVKDFLTHSFEKK